MPPKFAPKLTEGEKKKQKQENKAKVRVVSTVDGG